MVRLPVPGSDEGNWGTLLNDFLSQSHANDGTIKAGVIPESALASSVQTKINSVAGPTGATGPQGPSGSVGATGSTGLQGATGAIGLQGATGSAGVAGAIGATGPQGTPGATGIQGALGATGATGPAGATTIAGISGLQAALDAKADSSSVVGANIYVYNAYADAPALPVNTVVVSITGS